ncbi:MAG: hypothetical protein JNL11_14305 [Bdellovibrionaceae bacterium]|nr:hypothetical protein [Pseudobdellovibrionaceae bacterium]
MGLQKGILALPSTRILGAAVAALTIFILGSCTQVESPKSRPVQYGGACSQEYSKEYEQLLNWPTDSDNKAVCDDFYTRYPNVKCFSHVDGAELRIHTSDFDEACGRKPSDKSKRTGEKTADSSGTSSRTQGLCSPELAQFVVDKQKDFESKLMSFEANKYTDENSFATALNSKKICNQYFHNYKYSICSRNDIKYSFHDLKPYCDEFQTVLHNLRKKNPKKFSPEELKPLTGLNLKFHFQNPLLRFFSSKVKIKDTYIVEGLSLSFSGISSSQSYCFFESETLRFAGELKNEIYKVDIATVNKNRFAFSHTSFNEQWKVVCHFPTHFYLQDLIEVLGDTVSVFE